MYPTKEDYNNGIDHWGDCDDPLNCNCEDFLLCPKCGGSSTLFNHGNPRWDRDCHHCDYGFVHKDDYDRINNSKKFL